MEAPRAFGGARCCAVVETRAPVAESELIQHVRAGLAAYKAPKRVVWVDTIERSPSGKADYRWARSVAEQAVPSPS